jgi:hypothetical protein
MAFQRRKPVLIGIKAAFPVSLNRPWRNMPAVAYANKGLKIFEKGLADELFSQGAVGSVMPRGVGENNLPGRSGPKFCFASVKDRFWREAVVSQSSNVS